MSYNREKIIKKIPVRETEDHNNILVRLVYEVGSNFSPQKRGYYLSVMPVKIEEEVHYTRVTYQGYAGIRMLIEPAKRYSKKRMEELEPDPMDIFTLVNKVVNQISNDIL